MTGWWCALFPLASAALLWPCLIGSRVLASFDSLFFSYPFLRFAQHGLRQYGEFPFWLPPLFGGLPSFFPTGSSYSTPTQNPSGRLSTPLPTNRTSALLPPGLTSQRSPGSMEEARSRW